MNRKLLLLSLCAGTFIYSLVSIIAGQNGMWAFKQVQSQKTELLKNVEYIETLNDMLKTKHSLLKNDSEVLAAYAKRLGFVYEGEKIIKITGLPSVPERADEIGLLYARERIQFVPEWICKLLGIVFFLASYLFGILKNMTVRNKSAVIRQKMFEQYQV